MSCLYWSEHWNRAWRIRIYENNCDWKFGTVLQQETIFFSSVYKWRKFSLWLRATWKSPKRDVIDQALSLVVDSRAFHFKEFTCWNVYLGTCWRWLWICEFFSPLLITLISIYPPIGVWDLILFYFFWVICLSVSWMTGFAWPCDYFREWLWGYDLGPSNCHSYTG